MCVVYGFYPWQCKVSLVHPPVSKVSLCLPKMGLGPVCLSNPKRVPSRQTPFHRRANATRTSRKAAGLWPPAPRSCTTAPAWPGSASVVDLEDAVDQQIFVSVYNTCIYKCCNSAGKPHLGSSLLVFTFTSLQPCIHHHHFGSMPFFYTPDTVVFTDVSAGQM